jgi:hypothetical protein
LGAGVVNTVAAMSAAMFHLRKLLWVGIIVIVSIAGCVKASDQDTEMSRSKIDALIKKDLPVGTSREDVIAYLDKQKVEHSGHSLTPSSDDIYAIYRNTPGGTPVVKTSIQSIFHFQNGKLHDYEVKEVFTGP